MNRARNTTHTVGLRARFVMIGVLLTACQQHQQEPEPTAPPPPAVRHDTAALTETFPPLGDPVSASWITWGHAAPQSKLQLQWIDAVVQVAPETMDKLVTQHESKETKLRPAVQKVLEPDLPPGPFRTGVELNMAFGAEGRSTRVFLDPPRDTVVLQSSLAR
ncbi:MAG: hypothetical protein KDB44_09750 [Mycobacterium sp.]|nr:hypothetical protein [Mycobacterium sp.]